MICRFVEEWSVIGSYMERLLGALKTNDNFYSFGVCPAEHSLFYSRRMQDACQFYLEKCDACQA